jgi:hypothetical protein
VKKLLMFDPHADQSPQWSLCANRPPEIRGRGEISSRPQFRRVKKTVAVGLYCTEIEERRPISTT